MSCYLNSYSRETRFTVIDYGRFAFMCLFGIIGTMSLKLMGSIMHIESIEAQNLARAGNALSTDDIELPELKVCESTSWVFTWSDFSNCITVRT